MVFRAVRALSAVAGFPGAVRCVVAEQPDGWAEALLSAERAPVWEWLNAAALAGHV
jgi:hypothetical protein